MNIDLENNVNHRLAAVAAQSKRLIYRIISESGLSITPEQWMVLYQLWQEDGLTIGQLASNTKKDFANITRVVELLVRDGYIRKVKNPKDKRSCCVFILPKANEIKEDIQNVFHSMTKLSLKGINSKEQIFLLDILARIESNVAGELEKRDAD